MSLPQGGKERIRARALSNWFPRSSQLKKGEASVSTGMCVKYLCLVECLGKIRGLGEEEYGSILLKQHHGGSPLPPLFRYQDIKNPQARRMQCCPREGAKKETQQESLNYILIYKDIYTTNTIGQVRTRLRGVDQMKAGTQLVSAQSGSL